MTIIKLLAYRPVTLKIDHTIANGPTLAQCLAEEFDEAAQEFIQDKLFGSSETRMTVVYEDKSYLYIRLFLKPKGMDSLFCLNEELCKEGYAVHETSKRVDLGVAQLDEEPNTSYPVSFSDYARSYEKKKKEKEMLALQSLVDSGKMHRSKDPLYAGMQNVSTSQSPSKSPITKSFGRGRLLTMKDGPEVSANLSGSSSTSDVLRAFSPGRNHSSPLSRKYDSDRSSDHSFSMDDELSSSHDLRHTNVTKLDGVSSPYREERLQSVKVSVSDESFSSDVSGRNFSLGRGRKLREPLSQSPKGAQGKHTTSEASAASSKEFMLAQDLLLKSKVTQSTNERLDAVNPSHGKSYFRPDLKRHQEMSQGLHGMILNNIHNMCLLSTVPAIEKPSTPDLSCYPAGMPIKQIAKKSLTSLPLQRERPILPSTGTETGAKPKIECIKKPRNEKFDLYA